MTHYSIEHDNNNDISDHDDDIDDYDNDDIDMPDNNDLVFPNKPQRAKLLLNLLRTKIRKLWTSKVLIRKDIPEFYDVYIGVNNNFIILLGSGI